MAGRGFLVVVLLLLSGVPSSLALGGFAKHMVNVGDRIAKLFGGSADAANAQTHEIVCRKQSAEQSDKDKSHSGGASPAADGVTFRCMFRVPSKREQAAQQRDRSLGLATDVDGGKRKAKLPGVAHTATTSNTPSVHFYGQEAKDNDHNRALVSLTGRLTGDTIHVEQAPGLADAEENEVVDTHRGAGVYLLAALLRSFHGRATLKVDHGDAGYWTKYMGKLLATKSGAPVADVLDKAMHLISEAKGSVVTKPPPHIHDPTVSVVVFKPLTPAVGHRDTLFL